MWVESISQVVQRLGSVPDLWACHKDACSHPVAPEEIWASADPICSFFQFENFPSILSKGKIKIKPAVKEQPE